jgi:hypothetical protein
VDPSMRHRQSSAQIPMQRHYAANGLVPWNPPDSSRGASSPLRSRPAPARCRFHSPQSKPRSTGRVDPTSTSCRLHSWRLFLALRSALASELEPSLRTLSVGSRSPAAASRVDRERDCCCGKRPKRKAHAAGEFGGAAAGGGRSEVKRSRAGPPHGEPRTESPSEAAKPMGVGAATSVTGVLYLRWRG